MGDQDSPNTNAVPSSRTRPVTNYRPIHTHFLEFFLLWRLNTALEPYVCKGGGNTPPPQN
jgi:hypothetical protein